MTRRTTNRSLVATSAGSAHTCLWDVSLATKLPRIAQACIALLLTTAVLLCATSQAHAAPPIARYSRYDVAVVLGADGIAHVTMTIDAVYADTPGHGPVFAFITRQNVADTDPRYRIYGYDNVSVTSPTGADTTLIRVDGPQTVTYRVGTTSHTYTGTTHTYVVALDVHGMVNPNTDGYDEFAWNAIGTAGDAPIIHPRITLVGPGEIRRVACFMGGTFRTPCGATADGATATFTVSDLQPGQGMSASAAFPLGSFPGVSPQYGNRWPTLASAFPLLPVELGVAAGLLFVGAGATLILRRRLGDERPTADPFVVRFSPTDDMTPAEAAVLRTGRVPAEAVSATLVDLAGRGVLTIQADGANYRLTRQADEPDFDDTFEQPLLTALFPHGSTCTLGPQGVRKDVGEGVRKATDALLASATKRWFRSNPRKLKRRWLAAGFGILGTAGLSATLVAAWLAAGWMAPVGVLTALELAAGIALPRFGVRLPVSFWVYWWVFGLMWCAALEWTWQINTTVQHNDDMVRAMGPAAATALLSAALVLAAFLMVYVPLVMPWVRPRFGVMAALGTGPTWAVVGALAVTIPLTTWLAWNGWAWVMPAVALTGLVVVLAGRNFHNRTAAGSSAYEQTQGFERYLATVGADSTSVEEFKDTFDSYLPWAIVFGLTERWLHLADALTPKAPGQAAPWYSVLLAPDDQDDRDLQYDRVLSGLTMSVGTTFASAFAPVGTSIRDVVTGSSERIAASGGSGSDSSSDHSSSGSSFSGGGSSFSGGGGGGGGGTSSW